MCLFGSLWNTLRWVWHLKQWVLNQAWDPYDVNSILLKGYSEESLLAC